MRRREEIPAMEERRSHRMEKENPVEPQRHRPNLRSSGSQPRGNIWQRLDSTSERGREQHLPGKNTRDREHRERVEGRDEAYRKRRHEDSSAKYQQGRKGWSTSDGQRKDEVRNLHQHEPIPRATMPRTSDSQRTISDLPWPISRTKRVHISPIHSRSRPFRLDLEKKADPLNKGKAIDLGEPSDTGSSAKRSINFDVTLETIPATAEENSMNLNPKPVQDKKLEGKRKKSWFEMVEEEESEAENQNHTKEIESHVPNLVIENNTLAPDEEILDPKPSENAPLDITMSERVLAESDEDWGEDDAEQYMEELLKDDDLLGYDLFSEEKRDAVTVPENSIPEEIFYQIEPVKLMEVDDNMGLSLIGTSQAIEGANNKSTVQIPPANRTRFDPIATAKKKSQTNPPLIGFSIKNRMMQNRSSPKGKNKAKKMGLKQAHQHQI